MTDSKAPEFLDELLATEPELAAPVERLPELLEPVTPRGLERLMSAVREPPVRYAPFFARLSELWDLPEAGVRAVLERSRTSSAWRRAPLPGLELMVVEGGPRVAGAHAYLARFAAGMTFPEHRHEGHETVLILEGQYVEAGGRSYRSGDVHSMEKSTEHSFTIGPDEPCVAASVHHGIRFSSFPLRVLAKLFGA